MLRRKITLHSFKRYVKTIISDQVSKDYSEWFLGISKSPYYTMKEPMRGEIYQTKCMKCLTYLDYSAIESMGKDLEKKLEATEEQRNGSNTYNRKITLLIIFIAMGLVISRAALLSCYDLDQVAAQQAGNNIKLSLSALRQQAVPLLGNPSAHVTIIEFGDFQCPFCDRFAKDTEPLINQTYIQTGKVNMLFVHFTIYGPDSITVAMAAQCLSDQGKFRNFYEILNKNQGAVKSRWADIDNLKKFASQIPGLDTQKLIPVSIAENTYHLCRMISPLRPL